MVTDPLGVLLIAERAALLAGRDDEFVALVLMGFTGMRWGEVVGLEAEYARLGSIRVEWQLFVSPVSPNEGVSVLRAKHRKGF